MPGIITKDLIDISLAETTTGWSAYGGELDSEIFKQGSNSYTYFARKNRDTDCTFTPAANINMTGNYAVPHLYWTMRCNIFPLCESLNTGGTNSGLMVRVTDGSGNYVQWHLAGKDTWDGGWKTFILDLTNTTNIHSTSGTLSLADVDIITWTIDASNSGNFRAQDNTWIDAVRYGDGLLANSATTEAFDFTDIAIADELTANYYGVLQNRESVLFAQGHFILGDVSDTYSTNFVSLNEVLYFIDRIVASSHCHIGAVEATGATNPTDIDITGLVCKTVGNTTTELDFSDADINSLSIQESTFINMGEMNFATGDIDSNNFVDCGATILGAAASADHSKWLTCDDITMAAGSVLTNCEVNNSTATAAVITSDLESITNNTFTSAGTGHAIELTSIGDGSLVWNNNDTGYAASDGSTGNETLFVNVGSGSLEITVSTGSSTPTIKTAGATVTIAENPVNITILVSSFATSLPIEGASVYLEADTGGPLSEGTVILNTITDVDGEVVEPISLSSSQHVIGKVRMADDPFYKTFEILATINTTNGLSLEILLLSDD